MASPNAAPPPPTLGRYRLERRIGAGGMGEVFLARDTSLGRDVALKVMYAQSDSGTARRRFLTEASAMARLRHPNIVPVYDMGEEAGRLFFTMELVDGETLRGRIERLGRLDVRTALFIARDVALGLHHAHTHGIVHRDVKPDNVLLGRPPEGADPTEIRALVMDFGLARETTSAHLTQEGMVVGTIQYLSPEQAIGSPDVGPLADVYAIGATLYEALSGSPPFEGGTAAEVLVRIRDAEPVPLARRVTGLPTDVATLCGKAMAKSPSRRYCSALDLAADIDRYLRGEAILARPAGPLYRAWLGARRHRVVSAMAMTLVAVAVVLGGLHWMRPGTLTLRLSPPGARATIGEQTWIAGEEPILVDLPAGVHVLRVDLSDHATGSREVLVERGRAKDVTVGLRHEQGTLDAEAEPRGSEIEVDGVVRGSRIRGLPIDTGLRHLRAWSTGCFEREAEVRVRPGEAAGAYLWLESGVVWMERKRHGFRGQAYLVGDMDGDGRADLLSKDFNEIALAHLEDGKEVWRAGVAESTYFNFIVEDLGGDVGRVVVLATDLPTGLVVRCIRLRPPTGKALVWEATGPASGAADIAAGYVVAVGDRNGDGVRDIVAAGRATRLVVLDGARGKELASYEVTSRPAEFVDLGNGTVQFAGPSGEDARVRVVGVMRLDTGEIRSSAQPFDATEVFSKSWVRGLRERAPVRLQGAEVIVAGPESFSALDPKDGSVKWTLPGRAGSGCAVDWDGDGEQEVVLGVEGSGLVCVDEGRIEWTLFFDQPVQPIGDAGDMDGDGLREIAVQGASDTLGVVHGPRRLWARQGQGSFLATPVVTDLDADGRAEVVQLGPWGGGRYILCLDGETGAERWSRKEICTPNRGPGLADLDGDGRPELLHVCRDARGQRVIGIRGRDGEAVWECPIEAGEVYSAALGADLTGDGVPDLAFQRWGQQDILALDGARRAVLWSHPIGAYAMGLVAFGDLDRDGLADVVAPTMGGHVEALRGKDGVRLWRADVDGGSRCGPTMEDVTGDGVPDVLIVSRQAALMVLDGRDGSAMWSLQRPSDLEPWGRPAVRTVADGRTLVAYAAGSEGVIVVDWASRAVVWSGPKGVSILASPVVADLESDGKLELVLGTLDGQAIVADLLTGRRLWSCKVGEDLIEADPVLADLDRDGVLDVVVCDHAGGLHAIRGRRR